MSEQLNISIMAQADTATEVAPPSLSDAYAAQNSDLGAGSDTSNRPQERGPAEGTRRKPRGEGSQRNNLISEEENSAREISESSQRAEHAKPRREQTLQEALEGIQPETAEEFTLPSEFAAYDPADIEACLGIMGFSESDLQRPELAALVLKELNDSFSPSANEDVEDEEASEEESEEEKKAGEQKPEVKDEGNKPPVHTEMQPEDVKKYVEATWEKSQQVSHPQMSKLFEDSLATALETPPENRELLHNVCELLNYGGVSLVQSAMPAMQAEWMENNIIGYNHRYMQQFLLPILESFLPGIGERHNRGLVREIWTETLDGDEFSDKDLPAFGTPEFEAASNDVHTKNPWLNEFDPKGPDGKQLPIMDALRARAALTARLLVGERVDPKKVLQQTYDALEQGKRSAEKSNRRVSAGRALGAGRTTGSMKQREASERESLMDAFTRGGGGGAI